MIMIANALNSCYWLLFFGLLFIPLQSLSDDHTEQWRVAYHQLDELWKGGQAPNDTRFHLQYARAAFNTGHFSDAVDPLKAAIDYGTEESTEYVGMLCDVYYHLSRVNATYLNDVIGCLRRQYREDEAIDGTLAGDSSFWANYATALSDTGKFRASASALSRAQMLQPEGSVTHQKLIHDQAKVLLRAGRYEHMLELLEEHLWRWADDPQLTKETWVADAWHDAAVALLKMLSVHTPEDEADHILGRALHYTQTALRRNPDVVYPNTDNYYQTLSRIYLQLGRLDLTRASLWGISNLRSSHASREFQRGMMALLHAQGALLDVRSSRETTVLELLRCTSHDDLLMFDSAWLVRDEPMAYWKCSSVRTLRQEEGYLQPFPVMASSISHEPRQSIASDSAIVYLCCSGEDEVLDLQLSLQLLDKHFVSEFPYPIFIVHDYLQPSHIEHLQQSVSSIQAILHFVWLEKEAWQGIPPSDVDTQLKIFGYGVGYRHMCRFFSGPAFASLPALAEFRYLMRIDTDSFLLGPVMSDPLHTVSAKGKKYAFLSAFKDEPYFLTGLGTTTVEWMRLHGKSDGQMVSWLSKHGRVDVPVAQAYDEIRFCFTTNFFVIDKQWLLSEDYRAYFQHLDSSGGFYRYRWGDACVHFLAVAAMLDRDQDTIALTGEVPYWHQGTVILPEYPGEFSHIEY